MRRKTLYLIGTAAFFSWILVICYLFVHKPLERVIQAHAYKYKDVNREIEDLERDLKEQLKSNEQLLASLRSLKKKVSETGKSIDNIMKSNPSELDPQYLAIQNSAASKKSQVIPVLVFACNRVTVKRNIDQLLKYRAENLTATFPIIVSQDCGHVATRKVIESYGNRVKLIQQPDQSDFPLTGKEKKFKGYYKISRHYSWALNQTFNVMNHNSVIIVEDDLDISPDFYEYFYALHPILKSDPTLWCVSAWNDNGKEALVSDDPELLYRSDFFPGLGWMLLKDTWNELSVKWPKAFWDDWIRQPDQRKDRSCIRPEVSRTKTFGKIGVSNGLFYEKHLKFIKLNDKFVPFTRKDLTYLLKENYDVAFLKKVYTSPVVVVKDLVAGNVPKDVTLRVTYRNKDHYKKTAKQLGLMDDFKSGVPRTGYRGIVSFIYKRKRVFLAPPPDWKGYDTSWA